MATFKVQLNFFRVYLCRFAEAIQVNVKTLSSLRIYRNIFVENLMNTVKSRFTWLYDVFKNNRNNNLVFT